MPLDPIRLGCDLMNLFFVFDEYTDVEDKSGAQNICDVIIETMKNPDKPRPREVCIWATAKE
ncbi:hypothetical protein P691DRAFT_677094 [Macrolepiota fuliginosa MF-IS2]|uniref:Sesquiterpene synthase n=1 Tax=Macrolepiota fuliginosa MF-IS2 TaxID=1400762 RepID=A0A9P6C0L3_9AGAR|nr:hypothetical protein P691DRAFT_677094 [Macrolepiota fuliginosa MF-IS2]